MDDSQQAEGGWKGGEGREGRKQPGEVGRDAGDESNGFYSHQHDTWTNSTENENRLSAS